MSKSSQTYLVDSLHIPVSYMEAAILRCYSFLADKEYSQALIRLAHMTRGMGNPLVAAYARTYLCRVSVHILGGERGRGGEGDG